MVGEPYFSEPSGPFDPSPPPNPSSPADPSAVPPSAVRAVLSFATRLHGTQRRRLAGLAFAGSGRQSGRLAGLAFETGLRRHLPFGQAADIGAYALRVRIGGRDIDVCRLMAQMEISHAENQSYLCDFRLREDAGEVDVYRWHGKPVEVEVLHAGGSVRIYTGVADISAFHFPRRRTVSCSDRRMLQINRLPPAVVRSVGYTSVSAHGRFKDLAEEMAARLETVPASFEFDAYGTGYLTAWQPKAVADRTVGRCDVYRREPQLSVLPVGRVLNRVNIRLASQFSRLWQRDVRFSFDSGYHVCVYHWFGLPPAVADMKAAIERAGWAWSDWQSTGLEKGGVYQCGKTPWLWSPVSRKVLGKKDPASTSIADVSAVSVQDFTDYYARSASWSASRRWTQNVDEIYALSLQNAASIGRYGELAEDLHYTVRHEMRDDEWGRDYRDAQAPPPHFRQAANGDRYADLADADELRDTVQVAYWTAYTKMLASHRENTLELQVKFLPDIDLRHTHRIDLDYFQGRAKVAGFVHRIDFVRKTGRTDVRYKFFQNAADGGITPFVPPPPPAMPPLPAVRRLTRLGTVVLPFGAEPSVDGLDGFIVQTVRPPATDRHEIRSRIAFAVTTAAVEKALSDTATVEGSTVREVGIPDGRVAVRMV